MNRSRTGARVAAAACALAFLVAACGSDDDSADTADETTTTAADASTTTAADGSSTTEGDGSTTTEGDAPAEGRDPAEAEAIIEAVNLTIDDFADGWEAEEQGEDDSEDDIDSCFTTVDLEATTVAEGETPQFSAETAEGEGQIVNMRTVVLDSVETAEAVVAEVGTNQFAGCATDGFLSSFNEGGGDVTVELEPSPDDPPLAEESVGVVGAIQGTLADGTPVDGLVDLHVFRTADVVSMTLVADFGNVAFEDTLTGLYTEIATRHAAEVS